MGLFVLITLLDCDEYNDDDDDGGDDDRHVLYHIQVLKLRRAYV